jgi:hypothetical protein
MNTNIRIIRIMDIRMRTLQLTRCGLTSVIYWVKGWVWDRGVKH